MSSSFDLNRQNERIESRIVVALEKISEAFRVLLWKESKEYALSPIQIQILIFLLFHSPQKCKVSFLAQEFNMTKATVSDSIKLLFQKGLVEKSDDPNDVRSYTLRLTEAGKETAEKSSRFAFPIEQPLNTLSDEQKEIMLSGLLNLIKDLNRAGIITVQRMCFTCVNYHQENGQHFCKLIQSKLAANELKVDCQEHEATV